jgi:hypothetical protein
MFEKEKYSVSHPASDGRPPISQKPALVEVDALPETMLANDTVLHANGSSSTISFDPTCENSNIKLLHSAGHGVHEQPLLSLPA